MGNPSLNSSWNRPGIGCVQKKLFCNCCKIRDPDWCMLLILTESKSIHQSDSRILQQLQSSFSCWTQPLSTRCITGRDPVIVSFYRRNRPRYVSNESHILRRRFISRHLDPGKYGPASPAQVVPKIRLAFHFCLATALHKRGKRVAKSAQVE